MNFMDALKISSSGLTAQRVRMNVIASNLANAHTTRTEQGGPYRRKDVIFAAGRSTESFRETLKSEMTLAAPEVRVVDLVDDPRPFQTKYDPHHPDADENGYVKMPNIAIVEEMVNMISATRSYEANITALNASKKMALKALEIGT